jgi:kumamolisin
MALRRSPRAAQGRRGGKRRRKAGSGGKRSPSEKPLLLTFYLKHRRRVERRPCSKADLAELMPRVTRSALAAQRRKLLAGPIAAIRKFARQNGMRVIRVDAARRRVKLSASRAAAERVFKTKITQVEVAGGLYRAPSRPPVISPRLAGLVHGVLGLDECPRLRGPGMNGPDGQSGLLPSDFAALYGMATGGRGAGQCIALIEPKGGYRLEDLAAACRKMNVPVPSVTDVHVGGGRNAPGVDSHADMEVALDLQVAAGLAPQARIAVYFTPNSDTGIADGVANAVHDRTLRPSVIVITWGEAEQNWPLQARRSLDAVLHDAVRLGITVVAASGDSLATAGLFDAAHVVYPASSPYVLSCGGTQISLDQAASAITAEVVWNDGTNGTGGGISDFYSVPAFQAKANLPASVNGGRRGRGVPDIAAAAAETNGYRITLDNNEVIGSGTSAAAPLWGAFIALINERRGRSLGFVNDVLYQKTNLLRPITSGNNMCLGIGYQAGPDPGWNACTGLGAPDGAAMIAALAARAS